MAYVAEGMQLRGRKLPMVTLVGAPGTGVVSGRDTVAPSQTVGSGRVGQGSSVAGVGGAAFGGARPKSQGNTSFLARARGFLAGLGRRMTPTEGGHGMQAASGYGAVPYPDTELQDMSITQTVDSPIELPTPEVSTIPWEEGGRSQPRFDASQCHESTLWSNQEYGRGGPASLRDAQIGSSTHVKRVHFEDDGVDVSDTQGGGRRSGAPTLDDNIDCGMNTNSGDITNPFVPGFTSTPQR